MSPLIQHVVLVTGGRRYSDRALVFQTLSSLDPAVSLVVHGACGYRKGGPRHSHDGLKGADKHADDWASVMGVPCVRVPADWDKDGKAAGPLRNHRMVEFIAGLQTINGALVRVVAFPGGSGTQNCIDRAQKKRLPVTIIPGDPT